MDQPPVRRLRADDVGWMRDPAQDIAFGDALDEDDGGVDITFIRWAKGEVGAFAQPLPYDEVFVVLSGSYTVRTDGTTATARAGEVLYLSAGHTGEYLADEDALVVAVTAPPYRRALREAGLDEGLDSLTPE